MSEQKKDKVLEAKKDEDIRSMTVEAIMTSQVFAFTMRTTVSEAIDLILEKRISGAPIIDQAERVVSVVSESDLIKFAAMGGLTKTLGDFESKLVARTKLITISKNDKFLDIFKKFLENPVRRVIVIDSNGKLQGIVSRSNILKAFVASKKAAPSTPAAA